MEFIGKLYNGYYKKPCKLLHLDCIDVERKKKPRTTGPKSQQAHLHGHLSQIADYTGFYLSEIKEVMKEDIPEWPRKIIMGRTVYMSEADADTILESKAIEWCHVKAAFLGIILKED